MFCNFAEEADAVDEVGSIDPSRVFEPGILQSDMPLRAGRPPGHAPEASIPGQPGPGRSLPVASPPRHQRTRRGFDQTFARTAEQTIAAMNDGGHDIPNQAARLPLRIRRMGLTRSSIPVRLANPLGGTGTVDLSCDVDAFVDLAAERRGIHVSRIGDLLARLAVETFPSLSHYARRLHDELRAVQESDTATVAVRGVLTYLEAVRGVKDKSSLEHLDLSAEAATRGGVPALSQSVGFGHITACPCVQETYRNSFGPEHEALQRVVSETRMPLLTHSQRCRTRVTIAGAERPVPLEPLVACLDQVVVRSQNTLPREFELLNVHRSHAKPQFLEDVVRELTYGVYKLIARDYPKATIRIRSSSMESIHDFDLEGEIEYTVAELDRIFSDS